MVMRRSGIRWAWTGRERTVKKVREVKNVRLVIAVIMVRSIRSDDPPGRRAGRPPGACISPERWRPRIPRSAALAIEHVLTVGAFHLHAEGRGDHREAGGGGRINALGGEAARREPAVPPVVPHR